ncbi:MAG: Maf family nucleotide pyrophosphatase [Flavobacteriaceae bacterium]|nr:Maf family nucleotide pyrophosphatase [Flavobacteriaceae bacterium]MDG2386324.1 Maf family nucleotide pyrophosphatase [Flavobacteriaceae bacterium]
MDTKGYQIILASGSPRRKAFFEQMGIPFTQKVIPVEEVSPNALSGVSIVEYLVKLKAQAFESSIEDNQLVITADTIVWHQNQCLGKPADEHEAKQMLSQLSDSTHQVITAVGFLQKNKWESLHCISEVRFKSLSEKAITDYIATGSPMDKAGAYGIQDSFGMCHINSIKGSYTNIIGLPVAQVLGKIEEILKNLKS